MRVHHTTIRQHLRPRALRAVLAGVLTLALAPAALPTIVEPAAAVGPVHVDAATGDDATGDGSASAPYRSITSAVASATATGADVLVGPGVYSSSVETFPIDVPSGMTVRSTDGPQTTVVSGDGTSPVFTGSNQSTATAIQGFTITGGGGTHGGAIRLEYSAARILDNIIQGNAVSLDGGGIHVSTSTVGLARNEIVGNIAGRSGGGVSIAATGAVDILDSLVASNTAGTSGAGAHVSGEGARADILNATIVGNDAPLGAGVSAEGSATASVVASILWDNGDDLDGCTATYSDVENSEDASGTGNMSADPRFVGAPTDLRLSRTSPCIDVAPDRSDVTTATDLLGVGRPQDGDGDGTPAVDMGAYEMPYFALDGDAAWIRSSETTADSSFAGANDVRFDSGAGFGDRAPYAESLAVTVTAGDGVKTVRAEFRYPRAYAGESTTATYSLEDTVTLDTAPPALSISSPTHTDGVWSNDPAPTVDWNATDAVSGVADYTVAVTGESSETTTATSRTWTVPAPEGDTVVTVVARDRAGHESAPAVFTLRVDTLAPSSPSASSPSHTAGAYSTDSHVEIDVGGSTDPGDGTTGSGIARFHYSWTRDAPGDVSNYQAGPGFSGESRALPDGIWFFNVEAEDGAGNRSGYTHSGPYLIDTEAPDAPGAPGASASSGLVALDWPDNTESDVTSYRVYRKAGSGAEGLLGEGTDSAFDDATVENGVAYTYRVTAVDHLGQESQPSPAVSVTPWADNIVSRTAGADRYQTAIAIADAHFDPADVETVVLATGEDFADALAASGLAGTYDAPLLLVRRGQVPAGVFERIDEYPGLKRIFIVGGTGVISEWVQAAFAQRYGDAGVWGPTGVIVQRLAGPTRYDTAAAVAQQVFRATGGDSAERVLVARGDVFADALALAPLAYATERPVLLVTPDALPTPAVSVIRGFGVRDAVIAGGPGAVSDSAKAELDALLDSNGGSASSRWYGADRYATAAAIARGGIERGWVGAAFVGTATGADFPDALGGGVAAGAEGGVLSLTAPNALSPDASRFVTEQSPHIERLEVFGGTGAVGPGVESTLRALLD